MEKWLGGLGFGGRGRRIDGRDGLLTVHEVSGARPMWALHGGGCTWWLPGGPQHVAGDRC